MANTKTETLLTGDIGRMERETDMLMATVMSLSEDELRAPSKCEGWTRAHVVAHLALGADAMGNLVTWATTGTETPAYASPQARDADIEEAAKLPGDELKAKLRQANEKYLEAVNSLKQGIKAETVQMSTGEANPLSLPARRTTEVIVHHDDLDTTWEWHEADPEAIVDAIEVCVKRLQANPEAPGMTVTAGEGEEWVIGDGSFKLFGYYDEILPFIAREQVEEGLEYDGELPKLPKW